MNGPKQPQIDFLPVVSPALGENSKALLDLWKAEMAWRASTPGPPGLDELRAVQHDVATVEVSRLPRAEDPILPVRSELTFHERFHGKHGNPVVIKRK